MRGHDRSVVEVTARWVAVNWAAGDYRIKDTTTLMIGPPWHLNLCSAEAEADRLNAAEAELGGANPWAGQVVCPICGSAARTMPYGEIAPHLWVCVACHKHFVPEAVA